MLPNAIMRWTKTPSQLCDLSRIELRKEKKDIRKAWSNKVEAGPLITITRIILRRLKETKKS